MTKKSKHSKRNTKNKMNIFYKQIKNVVVAEGYYSTYTFFTLGKKLFMYSSHYNEHVFEIAELEQNHQQLREDLSIPEVLEVIHQKTQAHLRDFQQYFLPNTEAIHEEFWDEICRDQEESLSEKGKYMLEFAMKSENKLLDENGELLFEPPSTYNYFGDPVAYDEDDRQWMDYHMSQGNFEAALKIHEAYVKS